MVYLHLKTKVVDFGRHVLLKRESYRLLYYESSKWWFMASDRIVKIVFLAKIGIAEQTIVVESYDEGLSRRGYYNVR